MVVENAGAFGEAMALGFAGIGGGCGGALGGLGGGL